MLSAFSGQEKETATGSKIRFYSRSVPDGFCCCLAYHTDAAKTGRVQAMYVPILGYLAFIGLNLIRQFSYGFNRKGSFYFLPAAMTLFLISDFLVFLPMLAVVQESVIYNLVIWMFYLPAQLLIILFNSPAGEKVMNKQPKGDSPL